MTKYLVIKYPRALLKTLVFAIKHVYIKTLVSRVHDINGIEFKISDLRVNRKTKIYQGLICLVGYWG